MEDLSRHTRSRFQVICVWRGKTKSYVCGEGKGERPAEGIALLKEKVGRMKVEGLLSNGTRWSDPNKFLSLALVWPWEIGVLGENWRKVGREVVVVVSI